MGDKKQECECCGPCDLCGNGKIPDSLNLILSGAVDFNCPSAASSCDNDPSPLSPFSNINGTHVLNYSSTLTAAAADPCIAWYISDPIAYGDFLASTVGSPTCLIVEDAEVVFAAELVFTNAPSAAPRVNLYTYIGEEFGTPLFEGISSTEEEEDHSWLCDSELTSDEWVNEGITFYNAPASDDANDSYQLRFNLGDCFDIVAAEPVTIQMSRSAGEFTP
jgi:hypothetical protein